MNGTKIGLSSSFPNRLSNNNPKFNYQDLIGIGTQVLKWLKSGVIVGPISEEFAKRNNVSIHMLFGVPKPDGTTRPILNLSDKKVIEYCINDL